MEEDEVNIVMFVRRKLDLDISFYYNWKFFKFVFEDFFKRFYKFLLSVIKNKIKYFFKKYDNENVENQKMMGEKNLFDNCDEDLLKEIILFKLFKVLE